MPIKGLTDRGLKFPIIGKIRKGKKVTGTRKDGTTYERPIDLEYFNVVFDHGEEEAQKTFLATYGPQPIDINVILPFDKIDRVWDAYLEAYTSSRLVARSDGERLLYHVDPATGEVLARDGLKPDGAPALHPEDGVVGQDSKGKPIELKPHGRMQVVIPELGRAAYLEVITTSYADVANITSQLEAFAALNGGHIAGVPFKLRRRPRQISAPTKDGKRAKVTKWLLSIEADPAWVRAKLAEMEALSLPDGGGVLELEAGDEEYPEDEPDMTEDGKYIMTETFESSHGHPPEPGVDYDPDGTFCEEDYAYLSGESTEHIEVQVEEPEPAMTYEAALKVENTRGQEIGQFTSQTLARMQVAYGLSVTSLEKKDTPLTDEEAKELEGHKKRIEAITLIIDRRNKDAEELGKDREVL